LNRQAAEQARKRRDHESIGNAEINLADIFLMKNDLALAEEFLDGVHRQVKEKDPATSEWMRWRYSIHLFSSLAELQLARGDRAKAREFADHCLDLATRTSSRKYLVKAWRLRGKIAVARRQWDEGDAALRQALPIARAIGNPTQLWKTHLAVGRLHSEAGRPDAARAPYQAARAVIDRVRADLRNPELVVSLDRAPLIQQIYELGAPD